MPVKVQVYLTTVQDARICSSAGVDLIGVVADQKKQTPSSVSYRLVQEIFQAIPTDRTRVALTIESQSSDILSMIETVNPDIVHLACALDQMQPSTLRELRKQAPGVKFMRAIPMNTEDPIGAVIEYQSDVDYFILDTNDPNRVDIGATGETHDWSVSADLVRKFNVPVILAGGLSPENVAEAIRTVRPWGVDSFSHTNLPGSVRKDPERVVAFVRNAKSTVIT